MENTYKRNVRYQYYKIVLLHKDENGEWKVKSDFNMADWFAQINENGLMQRKIELQDCIATIERITLDNTIYTARMFKLRDYNVPSKVKDGEASQEIPLEEDEYIGEDITLLYDRENGVCMFQSNRMSLSVNRVAEWINKDIEENYMVSFRPIIRKPTKNTFTGKQIRTINVTFANVEESTTQRSLGEIIKGIKKFDGVTGQISIGVGRKKDKGLNQENTLDLIEALNNNREIVSSAKVKIRDGDQARVEIVDLFDDVLHDFITYDILYKKPLDFEQAKIKMFERYHAKKNQILELINKE